MSIVERSGEELARRVSRRRFLLKSATTIFATAAAFTLDFPRVPSAHASNCANQGTNPTCVGTPCAAGKCSGTACTGGCSADNTVHHTTNCWCTPTSCYNCDSPNRYCSYFTCCDCNCGGSLCLCSVETITCQQCFGPLCTPCC